MGKVCQAVVRARAQAWGWAYMAGMGVGWFQGLVRKPPAIKGLVGHGKGWSARMWGREWLGPCGQGMNGGWEVGVHPGD